MNIARSALRWAGVINFGAAEAALRNLLFGVVVLHGQQAVGMGRVILGLRERR